MEIRVPIFSSMMLPMPVMGEGHKNSKMCHVFSKLTEAIFNQVLADRLLIIP